MIYNVTQKSTRQVFPTSIVQQTAFWSEVKREQGVLSAAFNFYANPRLFPKEGARCSKTAKSAYLRGDMLVLLQQLDRDYCMAYVPYGPESEPLEEYRGPFLESLSESLRAFLPKGCIAIRYDLSWSSPWVDDESCFDPMGHWMGPPSQQMQEFRFNYNTKHHNLWKANTDILPSHTLFLNLRKDKSELLGAMKPKTRYNIQLSQRKGVTVQAKGIHHLDAWYRLYAETARRNHFYLHDIDYFRSVLTAKADHTTSPADVQLLVAEHRGQPLAAMFMVITGKRGTYLYGASSSENRNCMATYALQWTALERAREAGCTEYDMFGIAPRPEPSHPLYGLYRFKSGFGGSVYHTMGCWDYPLLPSLYAGFQSSEMVAQGYHLS
ncbi:MAG: lipid II:glycine glycyltransferase FemX [Bacteroidales bacterium]